MKRETDELVVSVAAALRRLSLEDRVSAITCGTTVDEIDYIAADLTQFRQGGARRQPTCR